MSPAASAGRKALLVLVVGGLAFFLLFGLRPAPNITGPAPALSLPGVDGRTVSLADFKGKVVLLDFWATWCEPCLSELPDLKRLHGDFKGRGFSVLGVSLDEDPQDVPPFIRENKVPYPVLFNGSEPPPGYSLPGIPSAFLIDRGGLIVERYFGPKSYDRVARDVERVLK